MEILQAKPLTEMSPEELIAEINLLRDRRLIARQQSIESNKPRPRSKLPKVDKSSKVRKGEEVDSEVGMLMDNLANVDEAALDLMFKNLEGAS